MSVAKIGIKVITKNKRATFDYELLDKYEAGIVLTGTEIKSVRANQVNLQQSYVEARDGELWLVQANIAEYKHGNRDNHDPTRPRKLLLNKRELAKIIGRLSTAGLTCIPTQIYLKGGFAKVEIAMAKGKKNYDKRESIAKKDANRDLQRALKEY